MIGLLGAMDAEVSRLREELRDRREETVGGITVWRGRLHSSPVALAQSGVGKVNAALATAALASLGVEAIIFTGLAGGIAPGIAVGDVVVASDLVQHDVDVTALGFAPGVLLGEPLSWPTDPRWRQRAIRAAASTGARVHVGRIASGDQFIASSGRVAELRSSFGALAAEMEGAATAMAATKLGVPFVVVRIISDSADDEAYLDFPAFLAQAAERSLHWVSAMLTG